MEIRVLALWSAPRSRSTAFLRMMVERGDRTVLHEPFSHRANFGVTTVGGAELSSEPALLAAIMALGARTPVFFKDTTDFHYPSLLADRAFLTDVTHTFILRHPAQAIASHAALNPVLGRDEIGFARLAEIYDAVTAASGTTPVVIDSDDLVQRPEQTVRAYCAAVGIPFLPEALSWQPGLRDEWVRTKAWHAATSRTSGFLPAAEAVPTEALNGTDPVLSGYLEYHLPYYQHLHEHRLRIDA